MYNENILPIDIDRKLHIFYYYLQKHINPLQLGRVILCDGCCSIYYDTLIL